MSHLLTRTHSYNLLFSLQIVWKRNAKSIANWSTFILSFKHLIPSKKPLFAMWIEHVPISKKCMAPLFWSSSASFDLNDLLILGLSIPKASNKLKSNPRSLTNSKKWSTRLSAVQWPTNKEPQYVTILRNLFEKKLTYPSYLFPWKFVVSSNLRSMEFFVHQ